MRSDDPVVKSAKDEESLGQAVAIDLRHGAPSFDALIYVDELKVLRAIVQTKLDACRACAADMKIAMADIEAALAHGHPRPKD